jgi:hypothetical protein
MVGQHGKNAASPSGCAGRGQAPYRVRTAPAAGTLPVSALREQVAHDQAPMPTIDLDVPPRVGLRPVPPPGDVA